MKIDHFAYEVSDLDASIRFYVDKLGFKIQINKVVDAKEHEAFVILETEGGRLELIQALSDTNQPKVFEPLAVRSHSCPHLALQVEDFSATVVMLKAEGIPILHGPLEVPGVAKWLYVCDPDRNVIEFCQDLSKS